LKENPKILWELDFYLISGITRKGVTALHLAAEHGHSKVVERLLLKRRRLLSEAVTVNAWSALHFAANKGHDEVVAQLIDAFTSTGATALHYAASHGHSTVCTVLSTAGKKRWLSSCLPDALR